MTLSSMSNLAATLSELGKHQQSLEMELTVQTARKRVLGAGAKSQHLNMQHSNVPIFFR